MSIRRTPPARSFRVASIADDSLPENHGVGESDGDDDGVAYDPKVVAQVLQAADGPMRRVSLEELYRELGISDDD